MTTPNNNKVIAVLIKGQSTITLTDQGDMVDITKRYKSGRVVTEGLMRKDLTGYLVYQRRRGFKVTGYHPVMKRGN